jgi:hypothetical protein
MKEPNLTSDLAATSRDEAFRGMTFLYDIYVKYLLLSGAGASVIAGFVASKWQPTASVITDADGFMVMTYFAMPILSISWAAGWAYLNVELWVFRHYLAYLDRLETDPKGLARNSKAAVRLHSLFLREIYGSRPHGSFPLAYHSCLDWLVALFPVGVGIVGLVLSTGIIIHWLEASRPLLKFGTGICYASCVIALYTSVFIIKIRLNERIRRTLGLNS